AGSGAPAPGSSLPELVEIAGAPDLGRIVHRDGREPDAPRRLALGWRWFLPGQPVREARGASSGGRELPSLAFLPVLSREGGWAEVLYQGRRGWVDESWQVPHPRRGARQGGMRARFEPVRASRGDLLRQARKLLGVRRTERALGAYELWTDVDDENLLAMLDQVAGVAEEAYFARFARLPTGDPLRSAVLFAAEADYRSYSGDRMPASGHAGHAAGGVLASYVEGRSRRAVATTVVHEIAHLMNARALARALPAWLEEGLAEELAALWVEDDATIDSTDRRAAALAASFRGPSELDRRLLALGAAVDGGALPRLPEVLTMTQEQFYAGDSWVNYAYAGAFVRYLLAGDGGRHRDGFLRFLERIADGYAPNPALLLDSYGTRDVEHLVELERGFRAWLDRGRAAASGRYAVGRPTGTAGAIGASGGSPG
ncbi:MAG TPA: hypothetical protein VHM02_10110, partial [Thermoanaerobaculia bacterium]|nr:hypothetical protein [Thermoanaerobaculia bacterium]